MTKCNLLWTAIVCLLFLAGCMMPPPHHYGPRAGACGPGPECLPTFPHRYSDIMHPAITPDGRPFLYPQQQLQNQVFGSAGGATALPQ